MIAFVSKIVPVRWRTLLRVLLISNVHQKVATSTRRPPRDPVDTWKTNNRIQITRFTTSSPRLYSCANGIDARYSSVGAVEHFFFSYTFPLFAVIKLWSSPVTHFHWGRNFFFTIPSLLPVVCTTFVCCFTFTANLLLPSLLATTKNTLDTINDLVIDSPT